ncbi:MAG TPA: DUF4189 domain-containing protein [Stellaceae bacterium]|jgi:hypothetical protein
MRRAILNAAGFAAALFVLANAAPAFAGYGALAYDEQARKYGLSANEETQGKADDVAIKICGTDKCKIVFRTSARECGAVAMADTGTGWGAGKRANRAAAELGAMQSCQKRTKGQCKVKGAECNR